MGAFILGIIIGLVFAGVGGGLLWSEWKFFHTAIRVQGKVISYAEQRNNKGNKVYTPIAAFEFDGEKRLVTGSIYSRGKPKIGTSCVVGVDLDNIEKARIYSKWNFLFYSLFLLMGIGALAGSVLSLCIQ